MTRHKTILWVGSMVAVFLLAAQAGAGYMSADNLMPPPELVADPGATVVYPNGVIVMSPRLANPTVRTAPIDGPFTVDSFFDVWADISPDGGGMWVHISTGGILTIAYQFDGRVGSVATYQAEIVSMTIQGGDLPHVVIRESPTLVSLGTTTIDVGGGGLYQIDSFFDVFTELSVDGGTSWLPAQGPLRLNGMPEPATLTMLAVGALALVRRRRS